jgi:hypothetical protein
MTPTVLRRGRPVLGEGGPSGHPLDLVRSSLDMVELWLHRARPSLLQPEPPDLSPELGEIAMLLRAADRVLLGEADQGRIAVLAWRVSRMARSRVARRTLTEDPSRAGVHALIHGCLHRLGCRDDEFDGLVRAALATSATGVPGSDPRRHPEEAWTRHLLLGDQELEQPPALIGARADDATAFAHELAFATDFGRLALPGTVDTVGLSEIADALVLEARHEDDLEGLAALLMTPALLRRDWTAVQRSGWRVLCEAWEHDGIVPGSGYRSTLVGGVTVATLVAADRLPRLALVG